MPDLILMPKSRPLMNHQHFMDHTGLHNNCMTLQMPAQMNEQMDFSSDLGEIVAIWGDQIYGTTQHDPKFAFWSLDDLREWVREHAVSDVYLNMQAGFRGVYICSTDQSTIESLRVRFLERKNHLIEAKMDSLMSGTVSDWIGQNIAGKHEVLMGFARGGAQTNQYMFRDATDATLFTVRWKGHDAVELL